MVTSEKQKIYNVTVPKGGYGYYTLYRGIYDPSNNIDERPAYAETGDLFEPYNSSVVYKATRSGGKTTWAIDESAKRQSEIGEGGGSSLPSMTGKNGKVLGVTLDAQDHEQAEWVTPSGGGSAEKFVVTLTYESDTWTADKTAAEIYAAYQADKDVVCVYTQEGLDYKIPCIAAADLSEGDVTTFVAAIFIGFADECIVTITMQSNGQEDSWDVTRYPLKELPDYSASQNGKVLGVSSGSLTWVDVAPLIVTVGDSETAGTLVGDKTYSDINTAMRSGKTVVLNVDSDTANYHTSVYVLSCALSNSTYYLRVNIGENIVQLSGIADDYVSITLGG